MARFWRAGVLAITLACATWPVQAANHAILVGVSQYRSTHISPLKGPRNDVTILWRLLRTRGFSDERITVLADNLPAGTAFPQSRAEPTRADILKSLDDVAARVRAAPNEPHVVFFYFSGHGTEQPVTDAGAQLDPEANDLDQVMLPIDAGRYDPARRTIENGIVDDELRVKFEAIRDAGADLFIVIDSCHSGSMTRSAVVGQQVRAVQGNALGVPAMIDRTSPTPRSMSEIASGAPARSVTPGPRLVAPGLARPRGSMVAFFAVHSAAEAVERPFPAYQPDMVGEGNDQRMGVFTYNLHRALTDGAAATYRDLAAATLKGIRANPLTAGVPYPEFEGPLDRPIFGAGPAADQRVWLVTQPGAEFSLPAGTLHGLAEGSLVTLSATRDGKSVLARASVVSADIARAKLALEGTAPRSWPAQVYARIEAPAIPLTLVVEEPPAGELADPVAAAVLAAARSIARDEKLAALEFSPHGAKGADIRLRIADGKLYRLPAGGEFITDPMTPGATPSLPAQGRLSPDRIEQQARALLEDLKNLATAQNLLRAAEAAGPASTGRLSIAARRIASVAGPGADPRRSCASEPRSVPGDAGEPIDSVAVPAFSHCDGIVLAVENQGERTMDVAFIFVSGTGEMEPLLGRAQGQARWCVSVPAGKPYALPYIPRFATWDARAGKPSTVGTEHIVIVGVERSEQNAQENPLCDLKSTTTRSVAPPAGYRGAGSVLFRIARDSAAAGRTRSVATEDIFAQDAPADPTVAMRVIPVNVVAPRS